MARIADDVILNTNMDRSEEILTILEDTFGADYPQIPETAMERYRTIVRDGSPQSARLAATYLEWCIAHPRRVGGAPALKYCKCDNGFIKASDDPITYRPCEKCLPGTFDKWSGVTYEEEEEDLGF